MKKLIFPLVLVLALFTFSNSFGQVKNVVKTSLSAPLFKVYTLAYERALNEDMSLQLGLGYFGGWKLGDGKIDGFTVTPEFRYYLNEEKGAPKGGFIAPYLRYASYNLVVGNKGDTDYGKASLNVMGAGILVGTQKIFKDVISLEAFIGPAYSNASLKIKDGTGIASNYDLKLLDGFTVRAGLTLGFAF
jgi:hypothetical protein